MQSAIPLEHVQTMEEIVIMAPAPAAARKRHKAKGAPTPADSYEETGPVFEYGTSFACRCLCNACHNGGKRGSIICRHLRGTTSHACPSDHICRIESVASGHAVTDTAPAQVSKYVTPSPAFSCAAPGSLIKSEASAPAVTDTTPVQVSEHVALSVGAPPAPVTDFASTSSTAAACAAPVNTRAYVTSLHKVMPALPRT